MTSWELIFLQSRVNHGAYDGDHLPTQNWNWPRGTWFQERLYYLRARRRQIAQRNSFKMIGSGSSGSDLRCSWAFFGCR
jgi:hypothetical protein